MYLDNAATTKVNSNIINELNKYMTEYYHNPSAIYSDAQVVKEKINKIRRDIALTLNCSDEEIYYTSGGSESNNWVIQGFVRRCVKEGIRPIIITTPIEHSSTINCINGIKAERYYVNIDEVGRIDLNHLEKLLHKTSNRFSEYKILVSIQMANNEIGTIQPIKEIGEITHKYNAIFHTDAVQAYRHIPIDVEEMNIDMLSASGHKIGALKGVGFLYKRKDINIEPLIYGTQEFEMRGGTENVVGIVSLGEAIKETYSFTLADLEHLCECRDEIIKIFESVGMKLIGHKTQRLPNNISIVLNEDISSESLIHFLDMNGIQVSNGSACNNNTVEKSHVLRAIKVKEEDIDRVIRITIPSDLVKEDAITISKTIVSKINYLKKIMNS